jgi:hypothetical protein
MTLAVICAKKPHRNGYRWKEAGAVIETCFWQTYNVLTPTIVSNLPGSMHAVQGQLHSLEQRTTVADDPANYQPSQRKIPEERKAEQCSFLYVQL